jgi:hypothetical protein
MYLHPASATVGRQLGGCRTPVLCHGSHGQLGADPCHRHADWACRTIRQPVRMMICNAALVPIRITVKRSATLVKGAASARPAGLGRAGRTRVSGGQPGAKAGPAGTPHSTHTRHDASCRSALIPVFTTNRVTRCVRGWIMLGSPLPTRHTPIASTVAVGEGSVACVSRSSSTVRTYGTLQERLSRCCTDSLHKMASLGGGVSRTRRMGA